MGFKEIEVGFPAASQTDFDFVRSIIDDGAVPDDVTISVLTQARTDLIERTDDRPWSACPARPCTCTTRPRRCSGTSSSATTATRPASSPSPGTRDVLAFAEKILDDETVFGYEYSPEIFTDTELEFALEVCEAVMDVYEPARGPRDRPQPARRRSSAARPTRTRT